MSVTRTVLEHLAQGLEGHASRTCFRMRYGNDARVGLSVSQPAPRDVLVHHRGEVVLAIEPELATSLRGSTIDLERDPEGSRVLILG